MRILLIIAFSTLLAICHAQSPEFFYVQLQEVARNERCDSVVLIFNKWIGKEQCLNSLQRVFIDKDLAGLRETDCWKVVEDSLKQLFFRKNKNIALKDIGFELWKMGAEDQKYRTLRKYINVPPPDDPDFKLFMEKQRQQQKVSTEKVYSLLKKYGWLNYELVGEEAETACFISFSTITTLSRKNVCPC
jgi:hypothetical protein